MRVVVVGATGHVGSHSASTDEARTLLGYAPRWTSVEAVRDAVRWLALHGGLDLGDAGAPSL